MSTSLDNDRSRPRQLYREVHALELPEGVAHLGDRQRVLHQVVEHAVFVRWPNGKPCIPVNMYLTEGALSWTGRTAISYASDLSHVLRYCSESQRQFSELTDADLFKLIADLRSESASSDPTRPARNDNRIRAIVRRLLDFLVWYQESIHVGPNKIVGRRGEGAMIVCERKQNPTTRRGYWHHRYMPESASTDPKLPISLRIIDDIDAVIESLAQPECYTEPALRRYKNRPQLFDAISDYLYERRKFMLWLLKRTGVRPSEMEQMSASKNSRPYESHALFFPTMKRRRKEAPIRKFPISPKDERAVIRYTTARSNWIGYCQTNIEDYEGPDAMFLSVEPGNYGNPISRHGMAKDFERLCALAGHKDHQACQSMFRHRFITYELLSLMKRWEQSKGPLMVERDYRSILERVRAKTGHQNVDSLFHYVDLAREIEGIWSEQDQPINRLYASDHLKSDLELLRKEIRSQKLTAENATVFDYTIERLTEIIGDADTCNSRDLI